MIETKCMDLSYDQPEQLYVSKGKSAVTKIQPIQLALSACSLLVATISAQTSGAERPGELVHLPFARGERIFTSRKATRDGVDFCVQKGPNGTPRVLISAAEAPLDAQVPLTDFSLSDDGRLCAYFVMQTDSRYEAIKVIDTETGQKLEDTVSWTHFGDFAWSGKGFYYGGYRKAALGSSSYSDERVLYHRLGTPQEQDTVVYEDAEHPKRKYLFLTTYDHRFFLLHILERVAGKSLVSELFRREVSIQGKFQPLQGTMAPGRF